MAGVPGLRRGAERGVPARAGRLPGAGALQPAVEGCAVGPGRPGLGVRAADPRMPRSGPGPQVRSRPRRPGGPCGGVRARVPHDRAPAGWTQCRGRHPAARLAAAEPDQRDADRRGRSRACPPHLTPHDSPLGTGGKMTLPAQAGTRRHSSVSQALARDRLGVPAVLFFVLAGVAPLTVAAGVIPTAYATTGLTGIPAAFLVIAVILALFATGYVAMTRHITNSGAFYAFISRGIGRAAGVAAALVALLSYSFLQVGLYGALGPNAASEAAAHLHVHAAWWAWALGAWAVITVLGLLRVDITGRILGVLLCAEIIVILAETVAGLAHP